MQEWDHSIYGFHNQPMLVLGICGIGAKFDATSESTIKDSLGIMYSTGKAAYKPLLSYSTRLSDAASRLCSPAHAEKVHASRHGSFLTSVISSHLLEIFRCERHLRARLVRVFK